MTAAPVPALQAGGSLRDGTLYVEREADDTLPAALRRGDFCYVLAPRQIGKSSLRVRTMRKLIAEGVACAAIDLTAVGTGMTVEQWYLSVLTRIAEQLDLPDPYAFWVDRAALTPVDRFGRWLRDVVLPQTTGPVVLFIDEIDTLLGMKEFPRDDFFAAVRAFYNDRADHPDFDRLTFCLLGVAAPGDLMADPRRTPFNIGTAIRLEDFSAEQVRVFLPVLAGLPGDAEEWLREVYGWTSGHPYMTQKLCQALVREGHAGEPRKAVQMNVEELFLARGRREDANLSGIEVYFARNDRDPRIGLMLRMYRQLLAGEEVPAAGDDRVQHMLRLSGIAAERRGILCVRNQIVATVFDAAWVRSRETERVVAEPLQRWIESGYKEEFLLRGEALATAREWWKSRQDVTPEEQAFIVAGIELEQREREAGIVAEGARRRREIIRYLAVAVIMLIIAFGVAVSEFLSANQAAEEAKSAAKRAALAEQDANEKRKEQEVARSLAESARIEAEKRQKIAVIEAKRATAAEQDAEEQRRAVVLASIAIEGQRRQAILGALTERSLRARELTKSGEPMRGLVLGMQAAKNMLADKADYAPAVVEGMLTSVESTMFSQAVAHFDQTVTSVAWSPNSQWLVVASGNLAQIREAKNGKILFRLEGHGDVIRSVAVSPDGRKIATASHDRTIRVWDAEAGRLIRSLAGHWGYGVSVEFSPDGRKIAAADDNRTVRLWDVERGHLLRVLEHSAGVSSVSFSPDGVLIATASIDGGIRLWEVETGKVVRNFKGGEGYCQSVAFSPDGQWIASRCMEDVRLWDAKSGLLGRILKTSSYGSSVVFSSDGKWVAAGEFGGFRLWETKTGQLIHALKGHLGGVDSVAFSFDGHRIATGSSDGTVRLWDMECGWFVRRLIADGHEIRSVAFSLSGRRVVAGNKFGAVWLWNAKSGRILRGLGERNESSTPISMSADGELVAASLDGNIRLWDVESGKILQSVNVGKGFVWSVAVSLDHSRVGVGSGPALWVWEPEGRKSLRSWAIDGGMWTMSFSSDGRQIATGSLDGSARVWDAENGRLLQKLQLQEGGQGSVLATTFSPDNRLIAVGGDSRSVLLFDTRSGRFVRRFVGHGRAVFSVAFSPDGRNVAVGSGGGVVEVWNVKSGKFLRSLEGHRSWVGAIAFSADGHSIATGSNDGTAIIRYWHPLDAYKFGCRVLLEWDSLPDVDQSDLDAVKADCRARHFDTAPLPWADPAPAPTH